MFIKSVAWFFIVIAAYPIQALTAITSIVLILTGKSSVIAGAIICGGILYFLARQFLPGFVRGVGALSGYRHRWTVLCWATYRKWAAALKAREGESSVADLSTSRRVDDA